MSNAKCRMPNVECQMSNGNVSLIMVMYTGGNRFFRTRHRIERRVPSHRVNTDTELTCRSAQAEQPH
jgi:hypothetical protein